MPLPKLGQDRYRKRVLLPPPRVLLPEKLSARTLRTHLFTNYRMRKVRNSSRWLFPLWVGLWVFVASLTYLWMTLQAVGMRRESLASMCDERARMLQEQFSVSMNHLQALAILVSTLHHSKTPSAFDQETFARYAERTAFERPLTSGVAYGVRVTHAEREEFERQQGWSIKKMYSSKTKKQSQGPGNAEDAEVREPAEEYAPVIFAQDAYKHFISFDLLSGADDRDNVLRARKSGKGVLTAPFKLLNNRLGVISTYAVYKYELPPNARPQERIQAAIGYLAGIFDIEALVDMSLHQLAGKPSIVVNVYDTSNERPISMYGSNDRGSGMCQVSTLNFGDPSRKHEMHCRFIQSPPWPWMPITTSIGTLVIGLLVGYIIYATAKRIVRVEDDFQEMCVLKKRTEDADTAKSQDETRTYKSLLQETAHRAGLKLPIYTTTTRSGSRHTAVFTCTVELAGKTFTGNPGKTKKQAEKHAAMVAWSKLRQLPRIGEPSSSSCLADQDDEEQEQGEMISALSINEFPTSSSLGTMGPLLRKLDLLLESNNLEAIKLLKEDLEEISADLVELCMLEHPNYKTRYWMHEVRELSYHIEDCIDNMVQFRAAAEAKVTFSGRRPQLRVRRHVKIPWLPKTVQPCARIGELRTLLWEARERHERYQLQGCVSSEPRFLFSGNNRAPAVAAGVAGAADDNLIGVDGARGKLTSWLIDEQTEAEQQQVKVLSILGPGGVGKTALVKELYRELGHQFECRAFVRVSRNPDMKRILGEILSQVQGRKQDSEYDAVSTADNLMDSIKSHIQDKRYFVVIDELWDAAAWNIMNIAFPKGNNYSRIIITAEGKDVASKCYWVHKLEMAPLGNSQDSEKIFFDRVFGSEHQCPDQLKDISYMIIRSCGGFPLAITTIASLLASQIDYTEKWDYLQKCFVTRLTGITLEEACKEVLNICYDVLPQDLKTCLLYLTMYPEGSTVTKADLLNQWIAEGFITPKEENQAVAESYFAELINRGMIQPEKIDHNDEVLSCTVHHIVFDLIAQKSREENFITAVDYSQVMPGFSMIARRLSLHFSCAQFAAKPEGLNLSHVRSLAFYGLLKCMPSITEFKFIRVLILEFWEDKYQHNMSIDPSKFCILFHLRYLKVSSHINIVLPSQIQRLKSLETLEIDAQVSAIPSDILCLPMLLHLSLPNGTELPDGIGRITSLRTLEYFDLGNNSEYNAKSLGELINLQNLHVTCSKALSDDHLKRNLVALSSSIGKLANLKYLRVGPFALGMTMFIDQEDMPYAPKHLERLELSPSSFIFSRLPTWIGALQKLCTLKIAVRVFLSRDIDTLTGLPVLAVLSLYVQKPNAESVVFNSGSLPALKYFKYRCAALRLGFQKEALPNLQRLKLCFNVHRAESFTSKLGGIENLLKLKEITAEIGAAAGADELDRRGAESALKEATRKHPRFPIHMIVKYVECIEEESTPVGFMHLNPNIVGFLALAVVVVVLIMLFWY